MRIMTVGSVGSFSTPYIYSPPFNLTKQPPIPTHPK